MYPDKVGRMIIDGVVDGVRWQNEADIGAVEDADKVMEVFFSNCAKAGPEVCAIWEKTPRDVSRRVDRILAGLRAEPIPLPEGPAVVTEDLVLLLIMRNGLYFPTSGFPLIAGTLRAVEMRDVSAFGVDDIFPSEASLPPWVQSNKGFQAVSCTDWSPQTDSLLDNKAFVRSQTKLSRWAGPLIFSRLRVTCGTWIMKAKNRFTGRVGSQKNVSMLIMSNLYDPVTPLSAARRVSKQFKGSRVLVHNQVGHCASLVPSNCIIKAMNEYMTHGKLPAADAVCQPDDIPFLGPVSTNTTEDTIGSA